MKHKNIFLPLLIIFSLNVGTYASSSDFFSETPEFTVLMPKGGFQYNPLKYYTAAEAQIYTALYEGLMSYDPITEKPIPAIAKSYEISKDLLTYTFTINPDAKYSNGDKITAKDFIDTWLLMISMDSQSPFSSLLDLIKGAKAFRTKLNTDPKSVAIKVNDAGQLEIILNQPSGQFLQILCHQSLVPVHSKNRVTGFDWTKPEGIIYSGPFVFDTSKQKANELHMIKNSQYWDKKNVTLSKIHIIFSDDDDFATRMFNEGEAQWISGTFNYQLLLDKKAFVVNPQFSTNFLFFNNRIKAFQDARVRKAITLLLDLKSLRDPDAFYLPTYKLVPTIPYYPEVKGLTATDRAQALELLKSAGFPNGKGLPEIVVRLADGDGSKRIFKVFEDAMKDTEIKVKYDPTDFDAYNENLSNDKYVIGDMGWIGDYADPLTFLDLFVSGGSLNVSTYTDPDFDKLIVDSSKLSGLERYKMLSKAEEKLLLDAAIIPLSNSPALNVIDKSEVDGWYENPFDLHSFKYIKPKFQKPPRNVTTIEDKGLFDLAKN